MKRTILVIEDDPVAAKLMKMILIVGPMAEREPPEFGRKALGLILVQAGSDHPAFHTLADWLKSTA